MPHNLHLLLTPDRSSGRLIRRSVAACGARLNVVVGTWPELIDHTVKAYLIRRPEDSWDEQLAAAAAGMTEAFWAKSLEVAPEETLADLGSTLAMLLEGVGPKGVVAQPKKGLLSSRAARHLADLSALHEAMGRILPPDLAVIRALLDADDSRSLRKIVVYHHARSSRLSPWQQEFIKKLSADAGEPQDAGLAQILNSAYADAPSAPQKSALAFLQGNLFGSPDRQVKRDDTLQWLAARDYLQEVEVAAGMIQRRLKVNPELSPRKVGLLLPSDRAYHCAVRDVFSRAGLPLSGSPVSGTVRDFGRETVLHFLLTRRDPPPAMALASLLTSQLMPWPADMGQAMAMEIMGTRRKPVTASNSADAKRMSDLIGERAESPKELVKVLKSFAKLLTVPEGMESHLAMARGVIVELTDLLLTSSKVPWKEILSRATPRPIPPEERPEVTQEGIAVFTEDQEPWRKVDHLFVLGFTAGHYPGEPPRSAIFTDTDLELLKEQGGYDIETPSEMAKRRRALFRRQLNAASVDVTFLLSRKDHFGKSLTPSPSLTFMARMFKGFDDPEQLLCELDRSSGRKAARGLAVAPDASPVPPKELTVSNLDLKQDLLALHTHESPSSLETLMVSPFAWLLERLGMKPQEWAPEALDVAIKGTLAHRVMERLFGYRKNIPSFSEISKEVPPLLEVAIGEKAPFLKGPEWGVERRHLIREIEVAAIRWKETLEQMGARVLGAELWLKGNLNSHPIKGSADLVIALPKGRLFVVDYKKSGSSQRRQRMTKGFDSQASLYRLMLESGLEENARHKDLAAVLKNAKEIGVLYYLLNDQVALTDTKGWLDTGVIGVEELGAGISTNAMELIGKRYREVRKGLIVLNRDSDESTYDKDAGMKLYALDNSPLVRLFMLPAEEEA